MTPLALLNLGPWEWVILFLVIFIVFGVGKLPHIGSGLGKGIRNFRKAVRGEEEGPEAPPDDKK